MNMQKKKRGRKSLGGLRIILRLTDANVSLLEERRKGTKFTRSQMIRMAVERCWSDRRIYTHFGDPVKK